jgi:nucleoside-diphosphate-sugar epimerase
MMIENKLLITGATGLPGGFFMERLASTKPEIEIHCLIRPTSDRSMLDSLGLPIIYHIGDSSIPETWQQIFSENNFQTIIHLVQLRQVPTILNSLKKFQQTPRLIIIGTTGVYSKYNEYSAEYKKAESYLQQYAGSYGLLRPTMIYGTPKDKNLHKLIKFCHHYGFFPVFGSGDNLLQPVHADDIAQMLLKVWECPNIKGAYDLSGGSIVSFRQLILLVEKLLEKSVRSLSFPLKFGIWSATLLEKTLAKKSPVRREQILRLQEDKAYSHEEAKRDLGFTPRTLEVGLQQEIELMRSQGII